MTFSGWSPLAGLGEHAENVVRALGQGTQAEVRSLLRSLEGSSDGVFSLALDSAHYALARRSGLPDSDPDRDPASLEARFLAAGEAVNAGFIRVERALESGSEGHMLLASLSSETRLASSLLSAAALRAEGSLARASGDLRSSLALLGRAVDLSAGSSWELVRSRNTLGTTYASLGLAGSARAELVPALELASALGELGSVAVAEGQLAVLALEEGDARRAVRSLSRQAEIARHLDDRHGLARALSLLVEAYGALSDLDKVKTCAEEARSLARAAGDGWTKRQALFATLYEAEAALAHGRLAHGDALLANVRDADAELEGPVRARMALSALLRHEGTGASLSAADFARHANDLRLSPRPAWVERALLVAARIATSAHHRTALALRATLLRESRDACLTPVAALSAAHRAAAIDRSMARGRDLLAVTRLALAPLDAWELCITFVEARSPRDLDLVIGKALLRASAAGIHDLLVSGQGPLRAAFARCSGGELGETLGDLAAGEGTELFSTTARMQVTDDPTGPLALVPASWHGLSTHDGLRDPLSPAP